MFEYDFKIFKFDDQKPEILEYLKNTLACPVCYRLMSEPMQLKCSVNHRMCKECIDHIKKDGQVKCPLDRQIMEQSSLTVCTKIQNQLKFLKVRCPNSIDDIGEDTNLILPELKKFVQSRCQWTGGFMQLEKHISEECVETLSLCEDCNQIIQMGNDDHSEKCEEQVDDIQVQVKLSSKDYKWKKIKCKRKELTQINQHIFDYLAFKPEEVANQNFKCQYSDLQLNEDLILLYSFKDELYQPQPAHFHYKADNSCIFEQELCPKCQFVTFKINIEDHNEEQCKQNSTYYKQALENMANEKDLELEIKVKNKVCIGIGLNIHQFKEMIAKFIYKFDFYYKKNKIFAIRVEKDKESLLELLNFWQLFRQTKIKIGNTLFELYFKTLLFVENKLLYRNFDESTEQLIKKMDISHTSEILNVNKNKRTAALTFQSKQDADMFYKLFSKNFKVFRFYLK